MSAERGNMSKIISFSVDDNSAGSLDQLMADSGYQNRSRFSDAACLSEMKRRGELADMDEEKWLKVICGLLCHEAGNSLTLTLDKLNGTPYIHSCLFSQPHLCGCSTP